MNLSEEELQKAYMLLFSDIDLTDYPDSYDPFNAPGSDLVKRSTPNQTIVLTATANGRTKTVSCRDIGFFPLQDCYCEEVRAFMRSEKAVEALLTSLPEWKAFPEYERMYD